MIIMGLQILMNVRKYNAALACIILRHYNQTNKNTWNHVIIGKKGSFIKYKWNLDILFVKVYNDLYKPIYPQSALDSVGIYHIFVYSS